MNTPAKRNATILFSLISGLALAGCPAEEDTHPVDLAEVDAPDASTADIAASDTDVDTAEPADVDADAEPDIGETDTAPPEDISELDAAHSDVVSADTANDTPTDSETSDVAVTDVVDTDTAPADVTEADAAPEDIRPVDAHDDADTCRTAVERAVWFYRHPGNPFGSDAIVGVPGSETTTLTNLQALLVSSVYGNYGERPSDDAAAIASWNAQLDAAGIESQLLIGDAADIFPGCREAMLEDVQTRLIDFNASIAPGERFDALHLDIEPQQYDLSTAFPTTTSCGLRIQDWPFWDDLDPAGRARRYEMLLGTLSDVRSYLDHNGHAGTPLYADLAPWIDSSSSFDWSATSGITDGTDWLLQAAGLLDGITLMTYERATEALIDSAVATESTLPTQVRVSVSAKERSPLSATTTWADLNAMFEVVEAIEATHCGARPVDLFNYRYLNE